MAQLPNLPQELKSIQVLVRFFLRIAILMAFAAFGSIGFGRSLKALLWMSIILCAGVALLKRETPFGAGLNHWDECAAFGALFALVHVVNELT